MEPLAALSVAAAVAQFVDFATGIIRQTKATRKDGQTLTHADFEAAVKDLVELCKSLKTKKSPTAKIFSLLDGHEAVSLVHTCPRARIDRIHRLFPSF